MSNDDNKDNGTVDYMKHVPGVIFTLTTRCHDTAIRKGFWDHPRNDGEMIALMHSELSEALEAMRSLKGKDSVIEELADVLIRIFDFCGGRNLDLGDALLKKMQYNTTRPYKHGKEF